MYRVLVAHGEPMLRSYLERVLAAAGHDVVVVDRGTHALPLLADETVDVLLADLVMPEMDGIELAQRCVGLSPDTRIMYLNGFSAVRLERSGRRELAPAGRPFHLRQIVAAIEERLPCVRDPAGGKTIGASCTRLPARQRAAKGTALPGEPG